MNTKFKLSDKLRRKFPSSDLTYTIKWGDECIVSWIEDGREGKTSYPRLTVERNFERGVWVKIEENPNILKEVVINDEHIKEVSSEYAEKIIEDRKPYGLFYTIEKDHIKGTSIRTVVGVDNQDGDAWVEEFDDIIECIDWLIGYDKDDKPNVGKTTFSELEEMSVYSITRYVMYKKDTALFKDILGSGVFDAKANIVDLYSLVFDAVAQMPLEYIFGVFMNNGYIKGYNFNKKCTYVDSVTVSSNAMAQIVKTALMKEGYTVMVQYEEGTIIRLDVLREKGNPMIKPGDKVEIIDAMNPNYIGKIGIVEEVSSRQPLCCKLNIDGKEGSWGNAWPISSIKKIDNESSCKHEHTHHYNHGYHTICTNCGKELD